MVGWARVADSSVAWKNPQVEAGGRGLDLINLCDDTIVGLVSCIFERFGN